MTKGRWGAKHGLGDTRGPLGRVPTSSVQALDIRYWDPQISLGYTYRVGGLITDQALMMQQTQELTAETPSVTHHRQDLVTEEKNRHDICQFFYTSTVSQILKFTREKVRKSQHFRLLILNLCNFIHIIWLISQFSSLYAHFILNLWLKWLKIPNKTQ